MRKKSAVYQISNVGVFKSPGHLHFNLIKMHTKNCFTKNVDFYIFEPQKWQMNEKYPKHLETLDH